MTAQAGKVSSQFACERAGITTSEGRPSGLLAQVSLQVSSPYREGSDKGRLEEM